MLLVLALGGKAWAGKPAIAILGLEVFDNGSGIDPETTKAAKDLTAALRDRARAGMPYQLAPGGDKELIDEKLINNCDSEAAACMAQIGNELGAEVLMYGKIEKSSQGGQTIYKVSLKVLNVNRKALASSTVETLPIADSAPTRSVTHAKAWYTKLAGATSGGTVVVRTNVDRGTVIIDDDFKGNVVSGTVTLSGIPEGRHTLAIEAKDYQRYETTITVRSGDTLTHNAQLADMPRSLAPSKDPISVEGTIAQKRSNVWKPIFYGATALEVAAAGFTFYEWHKQDTDKKNIGIAYSQGSCWGGNVPSAARATCNDYKLQVIGWGAIGVVGVAMVGSFVMAFVRDDNRTETTSAAATSHHKHRQLAVTPVVSPSGGGATLQFDW